MKHRSLVLMVPGVALLLAIGGYFSFAGSQPHTTTDTPAAGVTDQLAAPAIASPSFDTGCLTSSDNPGIEDFLPDEKSPMVDPCAGVICHNNADCQACCESGEYTMWRCIKTTTPHHCICANP